MAVAQRYSLGDLSKISKRSGSVWFVFFADRLASRIVYFLANKTHIRPNQVTLVSFIFGILAAYYFLVGGMVFGAVLYEMSFILDCVDGTLARLKKDETKLGEIFDKISDKIIILISLAALILNQTRLYGEQDYLVLGGFYLALLVVKKFLGLLYLAKTKKQGFFRGFFTWISSSAPLSDIRPIEIFGKRVYPAPSVIESYTFLFFISPLLNNIWLGLWVAIFLLLPSLLISLWMLFRQLKD